MSDLSFVIVFIFLIIVTTPSDLGKWLSKVNSGYCEAFIETGWANNCEKGQTDGR